MTSTSQRFDPAPRPVWRMLLAWLAPATVLIAGAAALVALHTGLVSFTGKPARDVLIVLATLELVMYLWVRLWSQMQMSRQVLTLAIFFSSQAALYGMVRLEGFAGDGRPMWTWRWTPRAEEVFDQSRSGRTSAGTEERPPANLALTTPWDCPAFRGADRSGRMAADHIDPDWTAHPPKLLWRQPVGKGWSSFAVVGNWCVTQEQRREDEATVCYELRTGREVWVHRDRARFQEPTGDEGPRATPTIHGGRVYALGATGILNCLDGRTGQPIWSVNILEDNQIANRLFGMAGSPLVMDSVVVVSPGGIGSSMAAYDLDTGKAVWKAGDAPASYSSPQYANLAGTRQVLNFNADGLFAHDFQSGRVLWSFPWISNESERNNVCQPVPLPRFAGRKADYVFVASGYGKGGVLMEISRAGERFEVRERWRNRRLQAKFSSVVVRDGYVYGLDGPSLACLNLATGERQWKGGHYGYGQLVLADRWLLVQLESGEVALVEASPEAHREVARFEALDSRTWNVPVLAGRILLVRNNREAACYELAGSQRGRQREGETRR